METISFLYYQCIQLVQWASHLIVKIVGAHAPGMPRTFSSPPWVSHPDMHHGTCVTQVPWFMPGSLTSGFIWSQRQGDNVPGIPGACATRNFTYLARGPLADTSRCGRCSHVPRSQGQTLVTELPLQCVIRHTSCSKHFALLVKSQYISTARNEYNSTMLKW